jgi:tetratricopeptide (TPR) repeat protein
MNTRVLLIEARRHFESAVKLRPTHPRYLELLGTACFVSGDALAAVPHFERAFTRERTARLTWLLAWSWVHAGRLADVERIVRELIEEGRGCARAIYVRSLARFKRRAFDLAIEDLREAMPDEVDVPFFRIELARVLIAAASAIEAPASLRGAVGPGAGARTRMLREATDLLRAGHVDDPGSVRERNYLTGCAYLELGEPTRALSVLAETDYPGHAEASFRRALAAARDGDLPTATRCFEEAAEAPDLRRVSEACATVLATSGRLDGILLPKPAIAPHGVGSPGAAAIVRLVVRGEPGPSPVAEARPAAPPPATVAPDSAAALRADVEVAKLEEALKNEVRDPDAVERCVTIVEARARLEPDLRRRLMRALATALHVDLRTPADDVARTVPLLERLRRARPGLAFPRLALARASYRAADWPRAIDELEGLPAPVRTHVTVSNLLGRCHEKLGRVDDAQRAYEDSLARRPDQGTIQFSLGRLKLQRYRDSSDAG